MPDYEIKEWNESNYDLNSCLFVKQAYEQKKWAFVTDFVRLDVIYHYGGIYVDTDVRVIRSFDSLLGNKAFMGFDDDMLLNTGLGFGSEAGNMVIKKNRDAYFNMSFWDKNDEQKLVTCPYVTAEIIKECGGKLDGSFQDLGEIVLYPKEYFCPQNYYTGELTITDNTYSVHEFSMSWMNDDDKKWHEREVGLGKYIGRRMAFYSVHGVKFVVCIVNDIKKEGISRAYDINKKKLRKWLNKSW